LIIIVIAVIALLGIGGGALYFYAKSQQVVESDPVTLTYWGIFDPVDVIDQIIEKYEAQNPNVRIVYERKEFSSVADYETELRNAFAEDRSPDMFTIANTWVPTMQSFIEPMPDASPVILDEYFDVVKKDVYLTGNIYGLPYSVDSLALFYNKKLLQEAGITNPPRTWKEFDDAVRKLTKLDTKGNFIQLGASLGGSNLRINRATDILAFFMLQQGTKITERYENAVVLSSPTTDLFGEEVENPGLAGLKDYLRYSSATDSTYTWNEGQDYSFDMFAQERVAMIFTYGFRKETIRGNSPQLDFGITPAPQPGKSIKKTSLANYWVETVSRDSLHKKTAWDFIRFATNTENVKLYSANTNKPASRRDLVNEQLNDAELSAFATQNLYAESWYQYDPGQVEIIFDKLLVNILNRSTNLEDGLKKTEGQLQEVLNQYTPPVSEEDPAE